MAAGQKVTPFDFLNSITYGKNDIYSEETKGQYVPYIINNSLSYFPDTVLYANDMNMYPDLPKYFQYKYFLSSIAKRRRFSKWAKKIDDEDVDLISEIYEVSRQKAEEIRSVLTPAQLETLRNLKTGNCNERKRNR